MPRNLWPTFCNPSSPSATTTKRPKPVARNSSANALPLADFDSNPAAKRLVDAFIAARLFTTCQLEGSGEPAVTVAHESLLRVWPRAKAWADNNRDFLHTRARIAARMQEGSPLLDGDPLLEAAKAHLLTNSSGFAAAQREWIKKAVAVAMAKETQATRRRRLVYASLSMLTLLALASAGWAFKRERDSVAARNAAEQARIHAEQEQTKAERSLLMIGDAPEFDSFDFNFIREPGVRSPDETPYKAQRQQSEYHVSGKCVDCKEVLFSDICHQKADYQAPVECAYK